MELEFVKTEPAGVRGYKVFSSWRDRKSFSGGVMKARTVMDVSGLPSRASLHAQMPSAHHRACVYCSCSVKEHGLHAQAISSITLAP